MFSSNCVINNQIVVFDYLTR